MKLLFKHFCKSRRGAAIETAIIAMLTIFGICLMLTVISLRIFVTSKESTDAFTFGMTAEALGNECFDRMENGKLSTSTRDIKTYISKTGEILFEEPEDYDPEGFDYRIYTVSVKREETDGVTRVNLKIYTEIEYKMTSEASRYVNTLLLNATVVWDGETMTVDEWSRI